MKMLMAGFLALGLCVSALVIAQDAAKQGNQTKQQSAQKQSTGSQSMSGTLSVDRRTFTDDKSNKTYNVSNPDALIGYEGQHVAILVHVDPDTRSIHIVSFEPPQP
jgi:anionic cell wall polymer biosynthesis LytR-Cps2A-Psr (LCP) family protein